MSLLLAIAVFAASSAAVPADVPQEDWEETLAALAAGGDAASEADLAALAGPAAVPRNTLRWARRRAVDGLISDLVGLDLSAGPIGARVRLRRVAGEATSTGAIHCATGGLTAAAGCWSWRSGFGLLAGAAGRRAGLTADGAVLPSRAGPRGWTGRPEERARRGFAATWQRGRWRFGGAWGAPADGTGGGTVTLASVGLADGGGTVTAVATDGVVTGFGGSGRWESNAWCGAWEIVWRTAEPAAAPVAVAAALDWRSGRRVGVGAVIVSTTGRLPTLLASTHELAGRDGGDGWAVRGSWSATPGVRFLGLYADRRRRRDSPGRERRRLLELQVRCRPAAGLETRVRFRGSVSEAPVWDPDWPWEAPHAGPSARRQSVGLVVVRTVAGLTVRTGLRTLSLTGTGTSGRRSLLGLEVRRTVAGAAWRAGWHEAWGDPVDLVSAISPLPGSLAPRHWGAWRGEVWAGFSRAGRRGTAAIACHLRRPRVAGNVVPEVRGEAWLRW